MLSRLSAVHRDRAVEILSGRVALRATAHRIAQLATRDSVSIAAPSLGPANN